MINRCIFLQVYVESEEDVVQKFLDYIEINVRE